MNKIKISQALDLRSELKEQLGKLSKRFVANCSYNSEKKSEFSFQEDLENYRKISAELVKLEARIARGNSVYSVKVPDNWKIRISEEKILLAEAVRYYSEMKSEISLVESLSTRSGEEKKLSYDYDSEGKRVRITDTELWISEVSEKKKDEMLTEFKSLLRSMDKTIKSVNNSKTV